VSKVPLLAVEGLRVGFPSGGRIVEAVRGIRFAIEPGEAVGLVGESGSGKSLTALAILRLVSPPGRILGGHVRLQDRDLLGVSEAAMRQVRGAEISIVFQDPLTSLNPAFTIGQQLGDILVAHRGLRGRASRRHARETLELVGIPAHRLDSYPYEFSGGMRQRALIAMAIACRPQLLIADEPTTALDVTTQAQIVRLLARLRIELGLSLLFITHNLDLMAEICDRAVVLYGGSVVEAGPVERVFGEPRHPYTRRLIDCIPRLDAIGDRLPRPIPGQPPTLRDIGEGCPFAPRCPEMLPICGSRFPAESLEDGRRVACWALA
jgi:oligopeptide/dipeptide ABC transporter ATP-binding protein